MGPTARQSTMYSAGAPPARQVPGSGQGTNASKVIRSREVEIWFWLLIALIAGCLGSLLLLPQLFGF